jgi:hypothetical protein
MPAMSELPPRPSRGSWVTWGLALVSAAYLVWLLLISIRGAEDAEAAGYVVGTLLGAFVAALVLRFVFVRLRPAESRPPFWSPWIIVLTVIILILSRVASQLGTAA